MTKGFTAWIASLCAICLVAHGTMTGALASDGWVTLLDGSKMGEWTEVGAKSNWRLEGGAVVADKLPGTDASWLMSKASYKDFQIRAEFWSDEDANSGIFIRCEDPAKVTSKNAYEVNIFDKRPDPTYGTGAIVGVAKVDPMPKAAGKWNVMEITAKGSHLVVTLNGQKTADVEDNAHAAGHVALQHGAGVIKFRKVEIKPL